MINEKQEYKHYNNYDKEKIEERNLYRKKIREILPIFLQLKYPIKDLKNKNKVDVPVKELLNLRFSKDPEDLFFIKILQAENKKRLGENLTLAEKKNLLNLKN